MDDKKLTKLFQRVKSSTTKHFGIWLQDKLTGAYGLGRNNMIEAMNCHPKIYKPTINEVVQKADEIRSSWDGTVSSLVEEIDNNGRFKTAEEIIHGFSPLEAHIYRSEGEITITLADKEYTIKPKER